MKSLSTLLLEEIAHAVLLKKRKAWVIANQKTILNAIKKEFYIRYVKEATDGDGSEWIVNQTKKSGFFSRQLTRVSVNMQENPIYWDASFGSLFNHPDAPIPEVRFKNWQIYDVVFNG